MILFEFPILLNKNTKRIKVLLEFCLKFSSLLLTVSRSLYGGVFYKYILLT